MDAKCTPPSTMNRSSGDTSRLFKEANVNEFERGALYGFRCALAGFLDDRSSPPRVSLSSSAYSEGSRLVTAAYLIHDAIQQIKALEDEIAQEDR
jgi:hypothetical protein